LGAAQPNSLRWIGDPAASNDARRPTRHGLRSRWRNGNFQARRLVSGLGLLASIPAIILGHMGLNQIKRNPGLQGGGMALAGLILGYIFTFLLPIISIIAISVLIALGNQVKSTFNTIRSEQATNSADQNVTVPDQSTNPPDSTTPAVTPDQSTNSAPAGPVNAPPVNAPSTNAPADSSTNAAPMSQ
jgi:hypothetical protein